MLPELGVSKPASIRSSVDLPEPEEPSSAKISPRAIEIETSSTAATSSKSLVSRSTRKKFASPAAAFGCMRVDPPPGEARRGHRPRTTSLQTCLECRVQARAQPANIVVDRVRRHQL